MINSFPLIVNFSKHIGSVECKRLITAQNLTLVYKTDFVKIGIKRIDNFSKSTQFSNLKSVRVDKWPKIADVRTERADLISKTADLNPED